SDDGARGNQLARQQEGVWRLGCRAHQVPPLAERADEDGGRRIVVGLDDLLIALEPLVLEVRSDDARLPDLNKSPQVLHRRRRLAVAELLPDREPVLPLAPVVVT